jgi:tRNA(His) guanylyltransferase
VDISIHRHCIYHFTTLQLEWIRFTTEHGFRKPNDVRALQLMNRCASRVLEEFDDVVVAYGQSDEFSFVLSKEASLFKRRSAKISTAIVSLFASSYVFFWKEYFLEQQLLYPPAFDARMVCYPSIEVLRDYLSWRQVDCHINNLYNTCFWTLVESGKTPKEAEERLCGTFSDEKNELLFSDFGINYNVVPTIFRRGSILKWDLVEKIVKRVSGKEVEKVVPSVVIVHEDWIKDTFWSENPRILEGRKGISDEKRKRRKEKASKSTSPQDGSK